MVPETTARVLPVGYYLNNFVEILDFVDKHYADILEESDKLLSQQFRSVGFHAQRLYVRLISRKGPHFRADKLAYAEIDSISAAATELIEAGLLKEYSPDVEGVLSSLLSRAELEGLIRNCHHLKAGPLSQYKKPQLIALLLEKGEREELLSGLHSILHWYTPQYGETLLVYRLLFFGNLHQDLTEFVLLDLGLLRYETYALSPEDRLFNSRQLVRDSLLLSRLNELAHLAEDSDDAEALEAVCAQLTPANAERSFPRRHDRILNRAARFFERQKRDDQALALYQGAQAPPSRERQARIHERNGRYTKALALCEQIAESPQGEEEATFAERFTIKVKRKLGHAVKPLKRAVHPQRNLALTFNPEFRVEEAVLRHYAQNGVPGFYAENVFWLGLFGLAFWDIIFQPVRGAFFNRYQRGPKGLFSARFRLERADAIEARLAEIEADGPTTRVLQTFDRKQGIANDLVHWNYLTRQQLEITLERVPRTHLAAMLQRLSNHLGDTKTGLPDLLLFPDSGFGYELVEVKGPGDQLQNNQRRWMAYFKQCGMAYAVARVQWLDK